VVPTRGAVVGGVLRGVCAWPRRRAAARRLAQGAVPMAGVDAMGHFVVACVNFFDVLLHLPGKFLVVLPEPGTAFSDMAHARCAMDRSKLKVVVTVAFPGLTTEGTVVTKALVWCKDYSA
jgi:hypothetical protein